MGRRTRACFDAGKLVVAGTSAGAAAVTGTMIIGGEDGSPPARKTVEMVPQPRLLARGHRGARFGERGRIGRLVAALAQNSSLLAVGIDADTAVEVDSRRVLHVPGSGSVTLLGGRTITAFTAAKAGPDESAYEVRAHRGRTPAARPASSCPV